MAEGRKNGRQGVAKNPETDKRHHLTDSQKATKTARILAARAAMTEEQKLLAIDKARRTRAKKRALREKEEAKANKPVIVKASQLSLSRLLKNELVRECSDAELCIALKRGYETPEGWTRKPTMGELLVHSTVHRAIRDGLKPQDFKILCEVLGEEFITKVEIESKDRSLTTSEAQAMLFGDGDAKPVQDVDFEEVEEADDDRE